MSDDDDKYTSGSVDVADIDETPVDNPVSMDSHLLDPVRLDVSVELGRARMTFRELRAIAQGAIVELDRVVGEPLDILANGHLIARGEVVSLKNDQFGIRVTELARIQNPTGDNQ